MECIACTACIDACDDIMTRLKRPTGLVRYASLSELSGGKTKLIRPRTILYAILLAIGATVATLSISHVQGAAFKLTRPPKTELFTLSDAAIANVFRAKLLNKTDHDLRFYIEAQTSPVPITIPNQTTGMIVGAQAEVIVPLTLIVDRKDYTGEFDLTLRLRSEDGTIAVPQKIHFIGPDPRALPVHR